ncbi:FG-GAP-like repeat-containing protein [Patiriisocius hiemis]|uniref:FG-GAP-like repeat-containing protein n=1 Tax=Patiriisocius hiemis TaxID=3075604 RepID=A0ABU2YD35_9FLAO|nr:FG-GAP-like repeat-containing protein [Constantimarinum sp. W242]MDT0555791.1 FG-GAP-like repeat-containing protein [Constantimarinum sp. W242]
MKIKSSIYLLFAMVLLCSTLLTGQTFGPLQLISTEALGARDIRVADIDNDGDLDIVTASIGDDRIAWYENLDGNGTFSEAILIGSLFETITVAVADLDNDGDIDVLGSSIVDDIVVWYENLDGAGTFSTQRLLTTVVDFPYDIETADIDGDGDTDVFISSDTFARIYLLKNNGDGTFAPIETIVEGNNVPRSLVLYDIDGDSDLDLVSSGASAFQAAWYENIDGQGTFGTTNIIIQQAFTVQDIFVSDIDGDGDGDLLAATNADNDVSWYANDGSGVFGDKQTISTNAESAFSVFAADLDNDGDMDVLSASSVDDKIAWYENLDGNGAFSSENILTLEADGKNKVIAADVDNDGDEDVLFVSQNNNTVAWFENLTVVLGVAEIENTFLLVYPNPVKDIVYIQGNTDAIQKVEIYNTLGQLVLQTNYKSIGVDVSNIASNILYLSIYTDQEVLIKKVLKN